MKRFAWLISALAVFFTLSHPLPVLSEDFHIMPGDILQVTVWKEQGMDREVVVLPDGSITFPLAGTITVQNITTAEAEGLIKEKLAKSIPDAAVTVAVKAPLGHKVNVLGQVQKPGEVLMPSEMSVMQALSQAGGLTPFASENSITIIRQGTEGKESIPFAYDSVASGRHPENDILLKPGDVIVVPTSGLF